MEPGNELSDFEDSAIDENGHTFIYTVGHASVERSISLGHEAAKMSNAGLRRV